MSKEFFKAVKSGNLSAVSAFLQADPQLVMAVDEDDSTGLHWAAWKGHADIVEELVRAGADLHAHNKNDHWGTTPLHAAAHGNQKQATAMLVKLGADVNAVKSNGKGTPLAETKVHNATAAAKILKEHGGHE